MFITHHQRGRTGQNHHRSHHQDGDHLRLRSRGQGSPSLPDAGSGDGALHGPLPHEQQRSAHQQVQHDGAQDDDQADQAVQEGVRRGHGLVRPPVDEAPGVALLQLAIRHPHHG